MPKLSVIIPIYNTKSYIEECLKSVMNQTFEDIEIICVNDGSTDGTEQIIDKYASIDKRIKVIHQKNRGQAEARKVGITNATGDYVAFVDSDDWVESNIYEKMYFFAAKYDTDAVNCGYFSVKSNSYVTTLPSAKTGCYTRDGNTPIIKLLYDEKKSKKILSWAYWTYLFKKSKIYDYIMKVTDVEQAEDMVGVWSFLVNSEKIYVLDEALYYYRVRQGSSCRRENPNYLTNINNAYNLLKQEFKKNIHSEYLLKILRYSMFDILQSGNCFTPERQDFFMFPYENVPVGSKLVLYGAGMVGKSYYRQIRENHFCNIVLWVDKSYESISNLKCTILNPEMINDTEFDYLLIAILEYREAKEIAKDIVEKYHVDKEKIILYEPKRLSRFTDLDN